MNTQYMQMNAERFKEQTDYLNMCAQPHYENMMTAKTDEEDDKPHYLNMQVKRRTRLKRKRRRRRNEK